MEKSIKFIVKLKKGGICMDLLSSELSIGDKVIKNRFIMAPVKDGIWSKNR